MDHEADHPEQQDTAPETELADQPVTSNQNYGDLSQGVSVDDKSRDEIPAENATSKAIFIESVDTNHIPHFESSPDLEVPEKNLQAILPINNARPSLDEDSKLVKFTLPTNSISLIHSNTPLLLNKSRDLLNFITLKSTNIMEKALLPQHLAMRPDPSKITLNDAAMTDTTATVHPLSNNCQKFNDETGNKVTESLEAPPSNPKFRTSTVEEKGVLDDNENLRGYIKQLEEKNKELELSSSIAELENYEKTVDRLTNELRMAINTQESLKKEYAAVKKDRESMVMKYAVSEKQLIDSQKAKEAAERKSKDVSKENELLQSKLKQAQGERVRLCGMLDTKCRELVGAQKEVDKLKEDVDMREVKLKWTQSKLKGELEMHKETQQKLDKAMQRINEMKDECDQVRRESQETIRKFQRSEENKAVTLDEQLKEQQAKLILERHVIEDKEMLRIQLQKEVETLKSQRQTLVDENSGLTLEIADLKKAQSTYEANVSFFRTLAEQKSKEVHDLTSTVEELTVFREQVAEKEEDLAQTREELEKLQIANKQLREDMECCQGREAYSLDYTQKLTETNVKLQSNFSILEARANELEKEQGPLREMIVKLKHKIKELEENLLMEKKRRTEECKLLAEHVAVQTQLARNLEQKLEDSKGEITVLRRKHQVSIKELTRELVQSRKLIDEYEAGTSQNSLNSTSRSASNSTLNADMMPNDVSLHGNSINAGEIISLPYNDLDKNALIERILKMQSVNVRRAEKLDFLEEHSRALVAELQKKTKIIQNYILRENFDVMGSNERDKYKAELVRHGGIMASVYNHRVSDDTMTLELSLEINQKLQAVLEDALLKNITLKDNIDTLGEEIARLTILNQQLKKSIK